MTILEIVSRWIGQNRNGISQIFVGSPSWLITQYKLRNQFQYDLFLFSWRWFNIYIVHAYGLEFFYSERLTLRSFQKVPKHYSFTIEPEEFA